MLLLTSGSLRKTQDASNFLPRLAGQAIGFATGEAALGRLTARSPALTGLTGRVPGILRPVAKDAVLTGIYGGASSDNLADVPGAVLKGAALGTAGGILGRGVLQGSGSLLSHIAAPAARRLTDAGVTLTPGQVLGASGGLLGRTAKGIEDRAAGFPIVGDMINSTRRTGVEEFNRAAINDALKPLQVTLPGDMPVGHTAIAHAQQVVSDAYDAALPKMRAAPDAQFASDLASVARRTNSLAQNGRETFANIMDTDVQPYIAGRTVLGGDDIQALKQGLDKHIANLRGQGSSPQDRAIADRLSDVRDAVLDLAGRTDPTASAEFARANEAFAMLSRVEGAAVKAKDGVFSPNQFRQAVTKRGYGTTIKTVASGSARMQQLATDASTVLPSTVPDSGSAGRLAFGAATRLVPGAVLGGAAGYHEGGSGGVLTGAMFGGAMLSRPCARATQYLLAGSRGTTANTLGAWIRRRAALGGALGSPLLLELGSK